MSALLASRLRASLAATEPRAHNRLMSEARCTLYALDEAARRLADAHPDTALRLRTRAEHLRSAIQANEG